MSFEPMFERGDKVRLTRPDTRMQAFSEGDVLILIRFDNTDNTWLARPVDSDRENWVAQEWLEPKETEINLDQQMAILLGVKHCATCTCAESDDDDALRS